MSFAFCFDREDEVYEFSYCYTYTYSRLQAYLDAIERIGYPYFKRELLCNTLQRRRLDLITITKPKSEVENKSVIVVTARVHPGETPSSYVCQGLIDFLVSDHPVAVNLREHLVFKIVPMLNPDGVYLGNYSLASETVVNSFIISKTLNKCSNYNIITDHQECIIWKPTIWGKSVSTNLTSASSPFPSKHVSVDFFIDIHAHSTLMNGFMYGNVFEDEEQAGRQAVFPTLLNRMADDFSLTQTNFNRDAVKAGTGRRTLGGILDDGTLCYTLEVSFFSYTDGKTRKLVPYTEEKYACLGRNLARTFHEYYAAKRVIPTSSASDGSDLLDIMHFSTAREVPSISTSRLAQQMADLGLESRRKSDGTNIPSTGDGPATSMDSDTKRVLPWLQQTSSSGDQDPCQDAEVYSELLHSKDLLEQLVRFNNPVGASLLASRTVAILKATHKLVASSSTSK